MNKFVCQSCGAEIHLPDELKNAVLSLIEAKKQCEADARLLATTWSKILEVLNISGENSTSILMKIPKLISKIQRDPEMFNFINPEIQTIIEKYSDK